VRVFGSWVIPGDAEDAQNVILRANERVGNLYSLRLVKRPSIKLRLREA